MTKIVKQILNSSESVKTHENLYIFNTPSFFYNKKPDQSFNVHTDILILLSLGFKS